MKSFFENYHKRLQEQDKLNAELSINLNDRPIETDCQVYDVRDNSIETEMVSVYFRNLEDKLIEHIKNCDVVVGCVAWLTNERILDALSKVECAIVVQKEDFLRPDMGSKSDWNKRLRGMYNNLKLSIGRDWVGGVLSNMSVCGDPEIQGVRCVGNYNYEKKPAFPRMHNKFLVFCKLNNSDDGDDSNTFNPPALIPKYVWTGSFNFTQNAIMSLENAVVLRQPEIVNAYYAEWTQIEAISEPLDWESVWCAPQWRIGT